MFEAGGGGGGQFWGDVLVGHILCNNFGSRRTCGSG